MNTNNSDSLMCSEPWLASPQQPAPPLPCTFGLYGTLSLAGRVACGCAPCKVGYAVRMGDGHSHARSPRRAYPMYGFVAARAAAIACAALLSVVPATPDLPPTNPGLVAAYCSGLPGAPPPPLQAAATDARA